MANTLVNQQVIIDEVNAKLLTEPKTNLFAEVKFVEGTPGSYKVKVKQRLAPAQKLAPGVRPEKQEYKQTSVDVPLEEHVTYAQYDSTELVQYGDGLDDEIQEAISDSLARGMDKERIDTVYANASTVQVETLAVNRQAIVAAKGLLGEFANEGRTMLWAHPTDANNMENDPDFKIVDNAGGTVGFASRIYGVDIIADNGVALGKPFLVKENAVSTYIRKDGTIESDKDIVGRVMDVVGTKHFGQIVKHADKFAVIELGVTPVA